MNLIYFNFLLFALLSFNVVSLCVGNNVKKSIDENDNGENNDDSKDQESLEIAAESNEQPPASAVALSTKYKPNTTCTRRSNTQMHEIRNAAYKQFPFVASIMSQQNEHLCSGIVVSNGLILTTAVCTQRPISYVLLNATKAKKDETTVALHVIKSERFPTFTTADSDKNVGLIYTEKHNNSIAVKVRLSNVTSANNVVDMEVIGFGLNADVGQIKELQYIGLENRLTPEHYSDIKDILSGFIDCIDIKVPTCFKDTGGPSVFENELVGIVVKGDDRCFKEISSTYAANIKVVDVLPTYTFKAWLDEKIKKNEEQDLVSLVSYPNKPSRRAMNALGPKSNFGNSPVTFSFVTEIIFLILLLSC